MGNCLLICPPTNDGSKSNLKGPHGFNQTEKSDSNVSSVRKNLIFTPMNRGDIKKYYDKVKLLGEGSMGSVALVQKKENFVGGSAYTTSKKGWFNRVVKVRKKAPSNVVKEGQRKMYALKSIILSRVSVSSDLLFLHCLGIPTSFSPLSQLLFAAMHLMGYPYLITRTERVP